MPCLPLQSPGASANEASRAFSNNLPWSDWEIRPEGELPACCLLSVVARAIASEKVFMSESRLRRPELRGEKFIQA